MTILGANRDLNLDLLRTAAITAVVAGHLPVLSPVHRPSLINALWIGQFGVDLFFVLSGWLIGGLYLREWQASGHVRALHFIARRTLRTLPPYYVALFAAWAGARLLKASHPAFDLHYMLVVQNYFYPMPYFAVSWSLCIEEHFYLILPLAGMLMRKLLKDAGWLLAAGLLISPLCRTLLYDSPSIDVFDPSMLATHTHLDGLLTGCTLAWLANCRPKLWLRWSSHCRRLTWLAVLLLLPVSWIPARWFYCIGYTYVSVLFAILVSAWSGAPALPVARWTWTGRIARTSYSIYLVHSFALQAARQLAQHAVPVQEAVYYLSAGLFMFVAVVPFYLLIERTAMRWRQLLTAPEASAIPALTVT